MHKFDPGGKVQLTVPQAGNDTSEDAIPIKLSNLLKSAISCRHSNLTKFSESPEFTNTGTGKLSNSPSTTTDLRLEGVLGRYGFC